jgi:hypothetical protein
MAQTLEAIVILFIVWQVMTRLGKNVRLSSGAKSEFKEAIDDAKNRLPNTGLFALFKGGSSQSRTVEQPEIAIEQTVVPAKGTEKENSE